MRVLLIILPLIMLSMSVSSQSSHFSENVNIGYEVANLKRIGSNLTPDKIAETQIAGSPYLDKRFVPSIIVKVDKSILKDLPLRYNVYTNNIEFEKKGVPFNFAVPTEIETILLGDNVFIYTSYIASKNVNHSYFQVLTDGKYQLLKMHKVVFKKPENNSDPGDSCRFESAQPYYYLRYMDGMARKITTRKELIKIIQPVSKEIIDYIQQQKIKVYDETELINTIRYINKSID